MDYYYTRLPTFHRAAAVFKKRDWLKGGGGKADVDPGLKAALFHQCFLTCPTVGAEHVSTWSPHKEAEHVDFRRQASYRCWM